MNVLHRIIIFRKYELHSLSNSIETHQAYTNVAIVPISPERIGPMRIAREVDENTGAFQRSLSFLCPANRCRFLLENAKVRHANVDVAHIDLAGFETFAISTRSFHHCGRIHSRMSHELWSQQSLPFLCSLASILLAMPIHASSRNRRWQCPKLKALSRCRSQAPLAQRFCFTT